MTGYNGRMNCEKCDKPLRSRGLCESHYRRALYAGDIAPLTTSDRWERMFTRSHPDECWEWRGWRSPQGYGSFTLGGRQITASRAAMIISTGKNHQGLDACHTCDNPPCVNPSHLYWGTRSQNIQDMSDRGRHPKSNLGENDWSAKFSDVEVDSWFEKHQNGLSFKQIARESGAHPTTVSRTIRGIQRRRRNA